MKPDFLLLAKGMLMGAADVVPGVSGGTIAFITGIYDRLLQAISGFLPAFVAFFSHRSFKQFLVAADAAFIAHVFGGILISIALASKLILFLLTEHPLPLWSFFFGLIIASSVLISKELSYKLISNWFFTLLGIIIAVLIVQAVPGDMEPSPLNAFFAGSIAICAMILPGISGSFILVLLGAYTFILGAVSSLNLPVLLAFMLGCLIGLLCFSRLLVFALAHARAAVVSVLLGFMIGSLYKVWPWKQVLSFRENRHGDLVPLAEKNVLPQDLEVLTGQDPQMVLCIVCGLAAVMLVCLAQQLSVRLNSSSRP